MESLSPGARVRATLQHLPSVKFDSPEPSVFLGGGGCWRRSMGAGMLRTKRPGGALDFFFFSSSPDQKKKPNIKYQGGDERGTRFLQSLRKLPTRLLAGGADKSGSSLEAVRGGGGVSSSKGEETRSRFFAINNNIKNNNKRSPLSTSASAASLRPGRWGMGARVPKRRRAALRPPGRGPSRPC